MAGAGFRFGDRRNQDPVTLVDDREVVGIQHRIKQSANTFAVEGLTGHDGDAPGDSGIKHHRGPENGGDFLDDVAQLGIVHRQLPFFFLGPYRTVKE
ncbi:hypothetical protein D3C84_719890 [compost metagenome]